MKLNYKDLEIKRNFEIERLADWHYDEFANPGFDDLRFLWNYKIKTNFLNEVLDAPYRFGSTARIHIGDPALEVNNSAISERSKKLREAGYTDGSYFLEYNDDHQLPDIQKLASKIKKQFALDYEHHCMIIVPAGQCMPVHSDTYSYLNKIMKRDHPEIKYDIKTQGKRYMMFLTDWTWGQSFGAGNRIRWQWNAGDMYTWGHKYLHWCSNASFEPLVFFEITGLELGNA